jgi:nucleotide-binding universal stress UspA family protein
MRVLVGVDGSSNSFAAVQFVGRLVAPERDELVLFFATPAMSFDDERLDPAVEARARAALSRAVLEAALERLSEAWRASAQQKEMTGSPGEALLAAANQDGADLIVVGFRGTSSLIEQFMLGSVSRTVVQSAKVPVLVVKGGAPAADQTRVPAATPDPLRVLAAYDGPPVAEQMAAALHRFTWPNDAQGWVMTVVRPMFLEDLPDWVINQPRDPDVVAMAAAWEQEHQQNLAAARQELQDFRTKLPACFARGDVIVAEGRPAELLVAQLQEKVIDLAVMGSGRGGRVERLLLGSTAEQVLTSAPCSVLIVR